MHFPSALQVLLDDPISSHKQAIRRQIMFHGTMGCFLVHLHRNSEMLPNYSRGIPIMKTKPNQKKIIEKSEKKSFSFGGI